MGNFIDLPYGKGVVQLDTSSIQIKAVLAPIRKIQKGRTVEDALQNPIGSKRLSEIAQNISRLLIITSDHTRPVPSKITLPLLIKEARLLNPNLKIKILIATGCHRPMRTEEARNKFGNVLFDQEEFVNHNAFDQEEMVFKGILPSGAELWLNKLVDWADMVVSEGFIEPHFFAGFSGGRKSILPGIASIKTVYANHCAKFINSLSARTGILKSNPIHADMLCAAKQAKLTFILNVILDEDHSIISCFAGDPELAHEEGCAFVRERCIVPAIPADIVITTNGGYPLDQNIYQSVKGMTAAEQCVRDGGVIIMVAECADGSGGEDFCRFFMKGSNAQDVFDSISRIEMEATLPDQWQAQILSRIMCKASVIMVSHPKNEEMITNMGMIWAENLKNAIITARRIAGDSSDFVLIPDGVGVIVSHS